MTLSKQQLETILLVLNDVARCHILGTLERSIYLGVDAELYRLANGPFTLAEAIASGRPFRRKNPNTNGKWITASYLDTYDYADESSYNDYIAVDYELYPEVGEG